MKELFIPIQKFIKNRKNNYKLLRKIVHEQIDTVKYESNIKFIYTPPSTYIIL
jgi:hypothetical protein